MYEIVFRSNNFEEQITLEDYREGTAGGKCLGMTAQWLKNIMSEYPLRESYMAVSSNGQFLQMLYRNYAAQLKCFTITGDIHAGMNEMLGKIIDNLGFRVKSISSVASVALAGDVIFNNFGYYILIVYLSPSSTHAHAMGVCNFPNDKITIFNPNEGCILLYKKDFPVVWSHFVETGLLIDFPTPGIYNPVFKGGAAILSLSGIKYGKIMNRRRSSGLDRALSDV